MELTPHSQTRDEKTTEKQSSKLSSGLLRILFIMFCVLGILSYVLQQNAAPRASSKIILTNILKQNSVIPSRHVLKVNCRGLITGSKDTIKQVKNLMNTTRLSTVPDSYYITATEDCDVFIRDQGYILKSMTLEEKQFPIAYSILVYKDVNQVERLLRAIYRPQNYYCIHVDKKASENVSTSIRCIANCFNNVFVTSHLVEVKWGSFTVLEPELMCMKELWRYRKWKYFINLTGQEFPLKTNLDLVRILKAYNGANDVEAVTERKFEYRWSKAGKPPHNIMVIKGSVHIAVNRGYVDYLLHNQIAKDLLQWVKKTTIPDEIYFTTLNHNPHLQVPGSYKVKFARDSKTKIAYTRFKNWGKLPCAGKFVRGICILGVGDLPLLVKAKELFANKFHMDFEPYALDCLEEWLYNRTRDEYLGITNFNNSFYKTLDFVVNKI